MIKLRGKTGINDANNKIIFEPRPGFNRGRLKTMTFPLIYGHRCPHCSNVIQALFKAPNRIDLWAYEETVILSQGEKNSGEVRRIFPDEKTREGKSCYRIDFCDAEGGSIKLTLKNHIMRHSSIEKRQFNGEGLWEPGEKPCTKIGAFALREDLLVKDFLLFGQMLKDEVIKHDIPTPQQLIKEDDKEFQLVPAVGVAPPVILVERQSLVYGYHYHARPRMSDFKKKKVQ